MPSTSYSAGRVVHTKKVAQIICYWSAAVDTGTLLLEIAEMRGHNLVPLFCLTDEKTGKYKRPHLPPFPSPSYPSSRVYLRRSASQKGG